MSCLDENLAAEMLEGTLPEAARAAVEEHLAECASCRKWISILAKSESLDLEAATNAGPRTAEVEALAVGTMVAGRYRVLRRIATGGMGDVYEVEDRELGLRVALKTIRTLLADDARLIERFKREVALARKVTHRNVSRVYDMGVEHTEAGSRILFLTMELLTGETLSAYLRRYEALDLRNALPILLQIAAALSAVHRAGVVHRDLKALNIMLVPSQNDEHHVVLTDFGLARDLDGDGPAVSRAGRGLLGSPSYMAPEQVAGHAVGVAADVYAFGVVMYEMATGQLPFSAETAELTAMAHLHQRPLSPRSVRADLDPGWERLILSCLAREPAERPTAETIESALLAWSTPQPRESRSRAIAWIAGLAVALGAVSIGGALVWRHQRRSERVAPAVAAAPAAPPLVVEEVELTVTVDPENAAVMLDDVPFPPPYSKRVPRSSEPHVLRASAPGRKPLRTVVVLDQARSVALRLRKKSETAEKRSQPVTDEIIAEYPR